MIENNVKEWKQLIKNIFVDNVPDSYESSHTSEIINLLDMIGKKGHLSHVFMPDGGGLDMTGAKISAERECIELLFGTSSKIVKPIKLSFKKFDNAYNWSYFRLDTGGLSPCGIYDDILEKGSEPVTQIKPNIYKPYEVWQQGYLGIDNNGYEIALPSTARPIRRYFTGSFVIFSKQSTYNKTSSTYDARHNKLNTEEFKKYIKKWKNGYIH